MDTAVDGDDPFASSIIPFCQITSSQEKKLQFCSFARESEVFPGDTQSSFASDESSEPATGIMMVSLPDSADDYQTPPEHHSYSQNSSNDGQLAPMAAPAGERKIGATAEEAAAAVVNSFEGGGQRTVDLAKDCDNLGFSEKSPNFLVEDNDTVVVDNNDTDQIEVNEFHQIEKETEIGDTEATDTESTHMFANNAHKVFDEMPLREQEGNTSTGKYVKKNVDDIDKFRYVGVKNKRELPSSLKGKEGTSEMDGNNAKHRALMAVFDRVSEILKGDIQGGGGDKDEDEDFLEIAKRRGMTFPRPRWWPPEGFED